MAGKHQFCWDACVFISLLTGEGRTPEQLKGLYEVEADFNEGKVVVFTSAISLIEVLECKLTQEQADRFRNFLKRPDAPPLAVDNKIVDLAYKLRNWHAAKGIDLAVPDAIHLATAIHYEATAFHTYDGCSKKKRNGDLLRLPRPIAGEYDIDIMIPQRYVGKGNAAIAAADEDTAANLFTESAETAEAPEAPPGTGETAEENDAGEEK